MYVMAFFTERGIPKTGLTPKVDVWRIDNNVQVITNQSMSEIGGGFYKYDFTSYNSTLQYAIRCDGGSVLSNAERYMYAGNEGFHDDITTILNNLTSIEALIRRILGLSQENYRLFNCVYDSEGKRLISCTIKIYNNKNDCDNNVSEITSYEMISTYGMNGQLSSYKVTRNV